MQTSTGAIVTPPPMLTVLQAATLLALLLGLQPVMTDLYLPGLPLIAGEFAAPLSAMQMTMSGLILAFGLMQLVWGPVADRFGRRPVLLVSLALMVAASLGAALASSMAWLIVWRMLQGAMLAAAVVCARAMVRDLYEPHQGAHVMSLALSGLGAIAIASPMVGGLLADSLGWRACLAAVGTCAGVAWLFVAWRMPETLATRDAKALHGRSLIRNAGIVLSNRMFRAWASLVASTYAGLFILLSASSYAYIGVLGLTSAQYGMAMAWGSLVYLTGTFVCRRWLPSYGLAGTVGRGAFFTLAGGLGMAVCAFLPSAPLPAVLLVHSLYTFGHGIHQPCGQAGAVGPFPKMAGVASALAGCALALVAFGVGLWLGWAMDGTLRAIGIGLGLAAGVTATVAWTLVRWHGEPVRGAVVP